MIDIDERVRAAIALLEDIRDDRALLAAVDEDLRVRILTAAGQVSRPDRHARKTLARERLRRKKRRDRDEDDALLSRTGIRQRREVPIFLTPRRLHHAASDRQLGDDATAGDRDGERRADSVVQPPAGDFPPAHVGDREDDARGRPAPLLGLLREADAAGDADAPCENAGADLSLGQTREMRVCYVCRKEFREVHHFYDQMCVPCGEFNWEKRSQSTDLRGRVALVTGSRVKIGYQAAIMLLRAGARVVCLTRFPHDAARRYAMEDDFPEWKHRLTIHGIDLRHTPSVEALCTHLIGSLERLDFIINNACQTVRRPSGFYDHLMAGELNACDLPEQARALLGAVDAGPLSSALATRGEQVAESAQLSQIELLQEDGERGNHLFPAGQLDADLQQVDLRKVNSWRLKLADVSAAELLEVHLVNAVAPFILNARLKPLMQRVPTRDKHIVNVSAMEGQFYRVFKSDRHPHTNMAKASLNMMTRTSAQDYLEDGIHMNSVDTGWVTDEDPAHQAEEKRRMHRFHPPLDVVDGAARIVDPIFSGFNSGTHVWGQFLKDYMITDW